MSPMAAGLRIPLLAPRGMSSAGPLAMPSRLDTGSAALRISAFGVPCSLALPASGFSRYLSPEADTTLFRERFLRCVTRTIEAMSAETERRTMRSSSGTDSPRAIPASSLPGMLNASALMAVLLGCMNVGRLWLLASWLMGKSSPRIGAMIASPVTEPWSSSIAMARRPAVPFEVVLGKLKLALPPGRRPLDPVEFRGAVAGLICRTLPG